MKPSWQSNNITGSTAEHVIIEKKRAALMHLMPTHYNYVLVQYLM